MRRPAGPDRLRPRTPGATGPRLPIAFRPDPAAVSDHILARIHRRTRMDGVKTAEGGEGATGEMAWAPLGWTGGGRRVLSRRTGPLWPSADVGPGKITGRGRSREPPGTGVAGTLGWPVDGSVADGRRQAGSGIACSRARARLNWFSQGQRRGRCRVRRRAERVSRPAREKNRRRRVLVVTICSPRPMRAVQRASNCLESQ